MTDWKAQAARIWNEICDIYGVESGDRGDDSQILAMLEAALERAAARGKEECAKIADRFPHHMASELAKMYRAKGGDYG